jgi:hypothetical protein
VTIKVKAKELGYYGGTRRRPGDIFEIEDEGEKGMWMIDTDTPLPPPKRVVPLTSIIQGTKSGGNMTPRVKEAWEEPVGESNPTESYIRPNKLSIEETKPKQKSKPKRSRR